MRIALCLSGGLRNFKDTFYSFDEFLFKKYNVDTFFYGVENKEGIEQNTADLIRLFQPKKYVINSGDYYKSIPCRYNIPTSYYSFYNVSKCNELKEKFEKENNFTYDVVIRSRTDFFWFRSITTEELELANNFILTPKEWSFKGVNHFALSDIFAFSTSALMDKYSETFKYIDKYCQDITFHPESIMGYHLTKHNVPTKEINRHVIYEYPSPRIEKYIFPYKFTKYFSEPNIENEDEFLRIVSNKRKEF